MFISLIKANILIKFFGFASRPSPVARRHILSSPYPKPHAGPSVKNLPDGQPRFISAEGFSKMAGN
jgi:hypothetical protein